MNQPPKSEGVSQPNRETSMSTRRHDLDALRSAAMLLGIGYHAALSFSLGAGWMVQDVKQSKLLYVFQAFVHGFRMQLFMILSGFFTAMLFRKKGLKKLLWNRFHRVLLPCFVGLFTVVPAIKGASIFAKRFNSPRGQNISQTISGPEVGSALATPEADPFAEHSKTVKGFPKGPTEPHAAWKTSPFFRGSLLVRSEQAGVLHERETESGAASVLPPPHLVKVQGTGWANRPVFILIWFLWFLVCLTLLFVIYAAAMRRFGWKIPPHSLILSQRSLLWLLPVTAIPGWFMESGRGEFGPDTSMGVLPMPHVLMYYALFFGFGVLYSECDDVSGRLGALWRWSFPVSVLVVFPIALEFSAGTFGLRDTLLPAVHHRLVAVAFQTLYAWMMAFAAMGMFRALLARERKAIRYLSDASYWIYLAHLPLVILLQAVVCTWPLPALLKFLLICLLVGIAMLASYETLVRYTFVGRFLNGSRVRPGTAPNLSVG